MPPSSRCPSPRDSRRFPWAGFDGTHRVDLKVLPDASTESGFFESPSPLVVPWMVRYDVKRAGEVSLPFQVTKYGHRVPGSNRGPDSGRSPARLPNPSCSVAVAHTEHPCDRAGETASLQLPSHPVHLPSAEDRGGDGRAPHVAGHEPHAPAPRIRGPPLGLPLQARLRRPAAWRLGRRLRPDRSL